MAECFVDYAKVSRNDFSKEFIGATENINIVLNSAQQKIYHPPANESISLPPDTYTLIGVIRLGVKDLDLTDLEDDGNGELALFECDGGKILDDGIDITPETEAACIDGTSTPTRVNAKQIPRRGRGKITVRVSSCGAGASESVTIAGNSPDEVGRLIEFDIVVSEDGGYSIESRSFGPDL